jgi:hypothetical protein
LIGIKFYLLIIVLVTIVFTKSYEIESIPITISFDREKVIFDGKWTSALEWKRSSLTDLIYQDGKVELRTAHQGNFIYVFIDDILDTTFTNGSDKATICFDTLNDKSIIPDSGDYCFVSTLGSYYPLTLQGNGSLAATNYFKKISNPKNLVAVGGISDENDRYITTPHAGYEFKIPTNFLGRESIYGFYMVLYHANNDKYYSWPENSTGIGLTHIPSPSLWGDLVSPDSSLPEFSTPIIIFISSLIFITYLTRRSNGLSSH